MAILNTFRLFKYIYFYTLPKSQIIQRGFETSHVINFVRRLRIFQNRELCDTTKGKCTEMYVNTLFLFMVYNSTLKFLSRKLFATKWYLQHPQWRREILKVTSVVELTMLVIGPNFSIVKRRHPFIFIPKTKGWMPPKLMLLL